VIAAVVSLPVSVPVADTEHESGSVMPSVMDVTNVVVLFADPLVDWLVPFSEQVAAQVTVTGSLVGFEDAVTVTLVGEGIVSVTVHDVGSAVVPLQKPAVFALADIMVVAVTAPATSRPPTAAATTTRVLIRMISYTSEGFVRFSSKNPGTLWTRTAPV
jgi:hypothetical protein